MTHTFAVCAYGDSPYLEACLKSLSAQTVPSDIILCTSTPSEYVLSLAEKYEVPVFVREGSPGIGADWNFAYDKAKGELVTLAHQDDLYERDYTGTLLREKEKYPDMSLFACASVTVKNKKIIEWGREEQIKKLLRLPFRLKWLCHISAWKRMVFLLGNPVICPSCAYDKKYCGDAPFSEKLKFVLDWEFLIRLCGKPGRFICCERPLVFYRVHSGAATYRCIGDHVREKEEARMFERLWPKPFSIFIGKLYRSSYAAYTK